MEERSSGSSFFSPETAGLTIFCYLYTAYADDTTFFLKDTISIENMVDIFLFLAHLWFKTKLIKWEITGIGLLKEVQVTVCGVHCVDLNNDTLKILGTKLFYNKNLKQKKTFTQL